MQLTKPSFEPGTCFLCRRTPKTEGDLFVDTNVKIPIGPRRERAYVCAECGGQIANALGWVDPGHHDEALSAADNHAARADEAETALAAAKEDALAFIRDIAGLTKPAPRRKAAADESVPAE